MRETTKPAPRARAPAPRVPRGNRGPAKTPAGGGTGGRPRTLRGLADEFDRIAGDLRYKRLTAKQGEALLRAYEAVLKAFELRLRYGETADRPWG